MELSDFAGDFDRSNRSIGSLSVQENSADQGNSPGYGQGELELGKPHNFFRRVGHTLLREKTFFFTLGGFLLLPLGALRLFWLFEYSDRNTKRRGAAIAEIALPVAFGLVLYVLFG